MKIGIVILMAGVLALAVPAFATIINVPDDYATIQEGIDACVDGDTVMVAPGIYTGPGNREISTSGKAIVVVGGQGAVNTIIDGEGSYIGFIVADEEQSDTVIEGFTIRNVASGVFCDLTCPTIRACIFENFTGRGIRVEAYSGDPPLILTIEDCIFAQTDQGYVGRGTGIFVYRSAEVTVSGCRFSHCRDGLEFYASSGMRPVFQIATCVIRDNIQYGIWIHS